jgi:hypothetical protein
VVRGQLQALLLRQAPQLPPEVQQQAHVVLPQVLLLLLLLGSASRP